LLERIPGIVTELSRLLAKASLDRSGTPGMRIERDKVYTILKDMLLEINRVGRYTFRHDPARAPGYAIAYTPCKRKAKEEKTAVKTA
jgi:hypothetical protein